MPRDMPRPAEPIPREQLIAAWLATHTVTICPSRLALGISLAEMLTGKVATDKIKWADAHRMHNDSGVKSGDARGRLGR